MPKTTPIPLKNKRGWYKIPGFSRYAANRKGEILNIRLEHVTQGGVAGTYRKVSVYPDGAAKPKLLYTHDLICRAFHGLPKRNQVVLHKDNDPLNIKPTNLRWGTQSENIKDMWSDGLRDSKEAYQEEDTSSFTHDGKVYPLNPVLLKAQSKEVTTLKIKDLLWNIEEAHYTEDRVTAASDQFPLVVLATKKWGYVVLDGTHRLIKAQRSGRTHLKAYVLTEDELEDTITYEHLPVSLDDISLSHVVNAKDCPPLYHLSFKGNKAGTWSPVKPDGWERPDEEDIAQGLGEPGVPRISMSPTLEQCFRAIYPNIDFYFKAERYPYLDIYAYQPDFKGSEKVVLPETLTENRWVWDAHVTQEHWVLESVKMSLVGRYRFYNTYVADDASLIVPFNDPKLPVSPHQGLAWIKFEPLKQSPSLENLPISALW